MRKVLKHITAVLVTALMLGAWTGAYAQKVATGDGVITGHVTDKDGEPLAGVAVIYPGQNIYTTTDLDGAYSIRAVAGKMLSFQCAGLKEQAFQISGARTLDVVMLSDVEFLDDAIVIGYGTQKKITATGSVTSTSGAKLQQSSSINLSQGLAGRMSGVIVNNRSGEPGRDDAVMYIRGRSTLGDNSPLIIIDGVAGRDEEFSRLSGDEIESVTVLKDASAAIYGSRSANGVILVTTRRGRKEVAPVINFTYDLGLQQPTRIVEMSDAVTFAKSWNAALAIDGASPKYSAEQISHYELRDDLISYPNTNWFDEIVKPVSAQHKYGVNISGGTSKVSYFVSAGGQFQDGMYYNSATNYSQYNIRSNIDVQITKSLKVGFDISARQQHKNYSAFPSDDYGIFYTTIRMYPTGRAYYPNGYLAGGVNPAVMVTDKTGYDKTTINSINTTLTLKWDLDFITKGLSVEGHLAYDINNKFRKIWKTPWQYWSYDEVTETFTQRTNTYFPTAALEERHTGTGNLTINALLNYDRTFAEKHHASAMLGFEQNSYRLDYFKTGRGQYGSDALDELFAGSADKTYFDNTGYAAETARRSFFGRIGYDYMGKYLIQGILRFDGSENFPKDRRWGKFPGVSAGWRISEEPWLKDNAPWLSNLKIRGSFGTQGNDKVDAFQYMTTYEYISTLRYQYQLDGKDVNVVVPGKTPNPNITWEVARTYNIGIDGAVFGEALTWEMEYFQTKRENILCTRNASIPYYTGLSDLPDENIGIVQNRGFEFQLSHEGHSKNRQFNYRISGNFLFARNRIIYMDESPWGYNEETGYDYNRHMKLEGHPMGAGLYYHTLGVFKTQEQLDSYPHLAGATLGDFIYEDLDGNGVIDSMDRTRMDLTTVPEIVYGLTFDASWKKFDLMVLFQGQARARFYYSPLVDPLSGNLDKKAAQNAWTLDNRDSDFPRIASTASNGGVYRNSFYFSNAAFLRLKNIELSYTLSGPRIKKATSIEALKIYVAGYNLLTFDSLKVVDPETSDESTQTYPQMKIYNVGLKLTF